MGLFVITIELLIAVKQITPYLVVKNNLLYDTVESWVVLLLHVVSISLGIRKVRVIWWLDWYLHVVLTGDLGSPSHGI